jgi:hypothetical protein
MSTLWCVKVAVAALAWADKKIAIWEKYNKYPMFLYKQSSFDGRNFLALSACECKKARAGRA